MENGEVAMQKGLGGFRYREEDEDEWDHFDNEISVTLWTLDGQPVDWEGRADTPISQIQEDSWLDPNVEKIVWTKDGESFPNETPVGIALEGAREGNLWLATPGIKPELKIHDQATVSPEDDGWGQEEETDHSDEPPAERQTHPITPEPNTRRADSQPDRQRERVGQDLCNTEGPHDNPNSLMVRFRTSGERPDEETPPATREPDENRGLLQLHPEKEVKHEIHSEHLVSQEEIQTVQSQEEVITPQEPFTVKIEKPKKGLKLEIKKKALEISTSLYKDEAGNSKEVENGPFTAESHNCITRDRKQDGETNTNKSNQSNVAPLPQERELETEPAASDGESSISLEQLLLHPREDLGYDPYKRLGSPGGKPSQLDIPSPHIENEHTSDNNRRVNKESDQG
jgi:hypothetical protein